MRVLITGGGGYIGAHCANRLEKQGIETVVFDNLARGHRAAVPGLFFQGDLLHESDVDAVFQKFKFDAVMHFAALVIVEESVTYPQRYIQVNANGTLNLLGAMLRNRCTKLVFSSTAAVYGNAISASILESEPLHPLNPYGLSKLLAEELITYYVREQNLQAVIFRYFNAAGREFPYIVLEDRTQDTHLLTRVLNVAAGDAEIVDIFGSDYETPDGTCVRDYIHVQDICTAHVLALDYLCGGNKSDCFNIGNSKGFSVKEVVDVCRRITGKEIPVKVRPRRPGDPAVLVAGTKKIRQVLGWSPQYETLESIVENAWRWHRDLQQSVIADNANR